MLLLTANNGDQTTISLPGGETISIVLIEKRQASRQAVFGIQAPDHCRILRGAVRGRIANQLERTPVFSVQSALHQRWLIAAHTVEEAISFYQGNFPDSVEVQAGQVAMHRRPHWLDLLAAHSNEPVQLPFGIRQPE